MFSIPNREQLLQLIKPPSSHIHSYIPSCEIPSFYQNLFKNEGWTEAKAYLSGYIIEEERECSIEEGKQHYILKLYKKINDFQNKIQTEEAKKVLSWFKYMKKEEDSNLDIYEKEFEYQLYQKREQELNKNSCELAKEIYKINQLIEYIKLD
jgi:hypothetical protein